MADDERALARQAAREQRAALEKECAAAPSSLYSECLKFAEAVEDGSELLLSAVLFSEQWSRPPVEEIAVHDALQAWDYGMHLKTMGEYAIADAYRIKGDKARHAFHLRKAEVGYPGVFWHSDAYLDYAGAEMRRARLALERQRTELPKD